VSEQPDIDAMAVQLRALAANMQALPSERKPLNVVLAQISGLQFLYPDLLEDIHPDLPPRKLGGCSGAHG
jgi:hypothetical protein